MNLIIADLQLHAIGRGSARMVKVLHLLTAPVPKGVGNGCVLSVAVDDHLKVLFPQSQRAQGNAGLI